VSPSGDPILSETPLQVVKSEWKSEGAVSFFQNLDSSLLVDILRFSPSARLSGTKATNLLQSRSASSDD